MNFKFLEFSRTPGAYTRLVKNGTNEFPPGQLVGSGFLISDYHPEDFTLLGDNFANFIFEHVFPTMKSRHVIIEDKYFDDFMFEIENNLPRNRSSRLKRAPLQADINLMQSIIDLNLVLKQRRKRRSRKSLKLKSKRRR